MLSVIIPARNEQYLERTIQNVLDNAQGEIEVLAMLEGYEPEQRIDDPRVRYIKHEKAIGQRQSINEGARLAKGEFIMKLDAHCAVGPGFDVILAETCEYDWTVIPTMYNLDIETWTPKLHKRTDYMYFSSMTAEKPFRAQYYEGKEKDEKQRQPKNDKMIDDVMCCMGPGFFMHKARFIEQGGCDEGHGSWGQQGIEVACKAWLSGGALKVNKNTWFAHWFRGGGGPGFPYEIGGKDQEVARKYSQDLWLNDKWPLATRKLQWIIDKFNPPGWNDLTILYYTANVVHKGIEYSVLRSLKKYGYPIVSVSQEPMDLGKNIVVPKERSLENIYRQVLIGAKQAKTKYVALCEDDCLYVPEHFKHRPVKPFAYNLNRWNLYLKEETFSQRKRPVLSQCIANREELIKCLEEGDRNMEMGREGKYEYETFETKDPNLVICHKKDTSGHKIPSDVTATEIPVWGSVSYWMDKFRKRGVC